MNKFIEGFDGKLSENEYNSPKFAYRVLFVAKTANRKGQADQVIEFIKPDSLLAQDANVKYALIKEAERLKFSPTQIVKTIQSEGFPRFSMHNHTELWKQEDAKNLNKGYGTQVVKTWYWYESWLETVRKHCKLNKEKYT